MRVWVDEGRFLADDAAMSSKPTKKKGTDTPAADANSAVDAFTNHEPFEEPYAIFGDAPKAVDFEKAIFFLDANTLLAPYRQDAAVLHAIDEQFGKLVTQGRLVVPFQAAQEFAKNRHAAIGKLIGRMKGAELDAVKPLPKLFENLSAYKEAVEAHTAAQQAVTSFNKALAGVLSNIETWGLDDPIYATYRKLFGPPQVVRMSLERDDVMAATKVRYPKRLPPGFGDEGKGNANKEGDLVIWRTILEVGAKQKKDAVFVTEEQKHDWFSSGSRFPRPELIDEYRRHTGGHGFTAMNLSEMMAALKAEPDVVEDLRPPQLRGLLASGGNYLARQRLRGFLKSVARELRLPLVLGGEYLAFELPSFELAVRVAFWRPTYWNIPADGMAIVCDNEDLDDVLRTIHKSGVTALVIAMGVNDGSIGLNSLEVPGLEALKQGMTFPIVKYD